MSEKTEQEKIAMCKLFLEKRGYVVFSETMTGVEVARLLGVTNQTISSWITLSTQRYKPDFPKPLAVKGRANGHRFLTTEIRAWAEKHCEVVHE